MIDRGFVGKRFPSFTIELSEELARGLARVYGAASFPEVPWWPPPCNWPSLLVSRGTACLMAIWEELGVDPLELRLAREEFLHHEEPTLGETLVGTVRIEDIKECLDPSRGIEEQVDLEVGFRNAEDKSVATYRCSFRATLLTQPARSRRAGASHDQETV